MKAYHSLIISAALLLCAGCQKSNIDNTDTIVFSAQMTKTSLVESVDTLQKTGFSVWACYSEEGDFKDTRVLLNHTAVKYKDGSWTYDNPITWAGRGAYKFYAIFPSSYPASLSGTDVNLEFKAENETYDKDLLLAYNLRVMAGQTSHGVVNFAFKHALSALKFNVSINGSTSGSETIKLVRYYLKGVSGNASLSYNEGAMNWVCEEPSGAALFNTTKASSDWKTIAPQGLDTESNPSIYVVVASGSTQSGWTEFTFSKALKSDSVSEWLPSRRYTYNVVFDVNAKLTFDVSVQDWNSNEALTPDIIIND